MSKRKILVVEDDPDMRMGLNIRLRANDFDVFFAADGATALGEARKHRPDVILLDLGLPAGDGFVVMQRLKSNTLLAMIPIIVVSARDRQANEARALEAGAEAFLQKPVDNEQLLATLRHVLGEA